MVDRMSVLEAPSCFLFLFLFSSSAASRRRSETLGESHVRRVRVPRTLPDGLTRDNCFARSEFLLLHQQT